MFFSIYTCTRTFFSLSLNAIEEAKHITPTSEVEIRHDKVLVICQFLGALVYHNISKVSSLRNTCCRKYSVMIVFKQDCVIGRKVVVFTEYLHQTIEYSY